MKKQEFDLLNQSMYGRKLLTASDLEDKTPRTLLTGYTPNRHTWHVYLEEGTLDIVTVLYRKDRLVKCVVRENEDFLPQKRLYPEACDYEFCKLLVAKGLTLPFTSWNYARPVEQFYGRLANEDLIDSL